MTGRWRSRGEWRAFAMAVLACGVAACSDGPAAPGQGSQEDAELLMTANVLGTSISTLVVRVSAPDWTGELVFNLTIDLSGFASGTLKVPPGPSRTFLVQAFDAEGAITHEGRATINVMPGPNSPVKIALFPRGGHVPVDIQIGQLVVTVEPWMTAVVIAGTKQLFAEVIAWGDEPVVVEAEVEWASENPAVVTVDQTGLVTGLVLGTTYIHASAEGASSARSQVTVIPAGYGIITGFVRRSNGIPLPGSSVSLWLLTEEFDSQFVDDQSWYRFVVPVGTYDVTVDPAAPEGTTSCTPPPSRPAAVVEGQITAVHFQVECS